MIEAIFTLTVFSLLNGITASGIFYLIQSLLKKKLSLSKIIWIGVITTIIVFIAGLFFILGVEKL